MFCFQPLNDAWMTRRGVNGFGPLSLVGSEGPNPIIDRETESD